MNFVILTGSNGVTTVFDQFLIIMDSNTRLIINIVLQTDNSVSLPVWFLKMILPIVAYQKEPQPWSFNQSNIWIFQFCSKLDIEFNGKQFSKKIFILLNSIHKTPQISLVVDNLNLQSVALAFVRYSFLPKSFPTQKNQIKILLPANVVICIRKESLDVHKTSRKNQVNSFLESRNMTSFIEVFKKMDKKIVCKIFSQNSCFKCSDLNPCLDCKLVYSKKKHRSD